MSHFIVHTKQTAPEKSMKLLEEKERAFGFIPNLIGVMAESPSMVKTYSSINKIFDETSLSRTERQVVLMAVSRYNECHYCMAAHSSIAEMQNVPKNVITSIRDDLFITDQKLQALREFATIIVQKRGWVSEEDVNAFINAGYSKEQVLEVIVGVAMKTLSNFTNHIVGTPVDSVFESMIWTPVNDRLAS